MASGLGVTVDPAGEVGSGNASAPAQAEVIPDNPGSIVQSTAIQTLDQLLHQNWIYDTTFTVSTNMPPGTVVFIKPIHPAEWNWPNKRVSSMFNLWTGSGKIRYRPLATAWYGGSIRVGFLPPNIDVSKARTLPLNLLTSYPNRDIDPKNTAWVDFRGPDQREVAYHYMKPFDSKDRQNFGGYIIFYVAGKLVTQSPEFSTIQFIVETAGDFMYDQPNPNALEDSALFSDPVGTVADIPFDLHAIPEALSIVDNIQIVPASFQTINAPGFSITAPGIPRKYDIAGVKMTDAEILLWDVEIKNPELGFLEYNGSGFSVLSGRPMACYENNVEYTPLVYNTNPPSPVTVGTMKDVTETYLWTKDKLPFGTRDDLPQGVPFAPFRIPAKRNSPIDVGNIPKSGPISPIASGESIVLFYNSYTGAFSTQTRNIRDQLPLWAEVPDMTNSWLYNLVGPTGVPLITLRLNPNGVFTTSATTAVTTLPAKGLTLQFLNTLPVSSPLPPPTLFGRSLMHEMRKLTQKGVGNEEKLEVLTSIA